mgnify:CR=1 FL=1
MEKNYYDILEVNKNASPEIIEKVYKLLIKKYHPDLQENNLKIEYEEKIKKINEAYEVLSNPEKRKIYDLNLKNTEISEDNYNNLINENINLKNEINYLKNTLEIYNNNFKNNINYINNSNVNENYKSNNNIENNKINNNYNSYNNNSKNKKYEFNFKNIYKNFLALLLTIIVILIIILILWNIPFTKNYLINLYNENYAFKFIINLFLNIFK